MTSDLQAAVARSQPGELLLPGYLTIGMLSRGHRLEVYDVWSVARRCRCVVKLPRLDRADEAEVRSDLAAEGELLRSLDHPHWVRVYEVVTAPEPAIVMQTLPGATLAALLDDHRRLSAGDALVLGSQVASALAYLHDLGWLHLDLTPGNVVVAGGTAILIDLSVARRPGPRRRGAGTAGYRPPEQARGDDVGFASDVWGLGLLLHEALTGRRPPSTSEPGQPLLPRRQGWRRLPEQLVDLVNACLADQPADRPTMDEVIDRLGGRPVPIGDEHR